MVKQHKPGFLKVAEAARSRVVEIKNSEVKAMLDRNENILLIDVREDNEWLAGHLPQATHLGRGIIERDIETLVPDPSTPIILYCGGGYRSALAADSLTRMGYTSVRSMAGGFGAWVEQGLPVENQK